MVNTLSQVVQFFFPFFAKAIIHPTPHSTVRFQNMSQNRPMWILLNSDQHRLFTNVWVLDARHSTEHCNIFRRNFLSLLRRAEVTADDPIRAPALTGQSKQIASEFHAGSAFLYKMSQQMSLYCQINIKHDS